MWQVLTCSRAGRKMSYKIVKTDLPHFAFTSEADRDYLAARLLNFCGKPMWKAAAYHTQQCLEKYLKAFLVQKQNYYLETHNLKILVKQCGKRGMKLGNDTERLLEIFDNFEQVARYGAFANYDPLALRGSGFKVKGNFIWTDSNIKDMDKLVHLIRSNIDFSSNPPEDGLKALLYGKLLPNWLSGWHLPGINFKQILTAHNDYYRE